jgi:formate dehydrogenase major subunit
MYAMGWTQHTTGTQNIRTMAIIQLLLGNMGVAGGGVNALRGESNVQGSTDHCLLWHIWPGYLKTPGPPMFPWRPTTKNGRRRARIRCPPTGGRTTPNTVSPCSSLFSGMPPQPDNDFGYNWLPKVDDGVGYSWLDLFDAMYNGKIKGFFAWGQNPACSGSNAGKIRQGHDQTGLAGQRQSVRQRDRFVLEGTRHGSASIKTEVFMLPACASMEKEGSITNSGRWMQWRYQGPKPKGNSRPTATSSSNWAKRMKELYAAGGVFPEPILNLKWDYAPRRRIRCPQGGQRDQRLLFSKT